MMRAKLNAAKTILLSTIFSLTGLWAVKILNGPWIFPLLFSLAIPLANWKSLGDRKVVKTVLICVATIIILFLGLALGFVAADSKLIWLSLSVSGMVGIVLLSVLSNFFSNMHINVLTYLVTFILCFVAFPLGNWVVNITIGRTNSDIIFVSWTFLFTLGVATAIVQKNTTANKCI